ncbi:MAG: hypothetical protein ACC742_11375 [Thermoanaerobaculales bacterium]
MGTWDAGWEIEFPATTVDEMMLALVVRDLVHGASFDVEAIEDGTELALDFLAGDEVADEAYRLLLSAEIDGPEGREMVQEFTEQMLEELVSEAEVLGVQRVDLSSRPIDELVFHAVPEEEERWDLIIPDWLAPDGAEVPFGFRSFLVADGEPWPGDPVLEEHGRVVLVPFAGRAHLFGIPAPESPEEEEDPGLLPVHP